MHPRLPKTHLQQGGVDPTPSMTNNSFHQCILLVILVLLTHRT